MMMIRVLVLFFLLGISSISYGQFDDVYYSVDDELCYSSNLRRFYQPISVVGFYNYRYVYPFTYTTFDPFWNVNFYFNRYPVRTWFVNNFWYGWNVPTYTITTYYGWNNYWYHNNYNWHYNYNTTYVVPQTNNHNTHYGPRQGGVSVGGNRGKSYTTNNTVTTNTNISTNRLNKLDNNSITNSRVRNNTNIQFNSNQNNSSRIKETNTNVNRGSLSSPTQRGNSNSSNINNSNSRTRDKK